MLRLTAVFIAICVIVIAASIGAVSYLLLGLSLVEASLVALATLSALALYNTITARLRDRSHVSDQIADLSRGTADLARQVAEIGRRQIALENQEAARRDRGPNQALQAEIGELGVLVKQLAETVAAHDSKLAELRRRPQPVPVQAEALPIAFAPAAPAPVASPEFRRDVRAAEPERLFPVEAIGSGPFKGKSEADIAAIIRGAIEDNRIDLYLQPVVTLPQRKVRYYEALTRLRMNDGTLILPSDFLKHAESAGLMARIDNTQLFRCVQVLRRLLLKNREVGLFCNVSAQTLNDMDMFRQFFDFLDANRALSSSLTLEFSQAALRAMGPLEQESLGAVIALGYRFSMDHVLDLRMGPRDLSELGVRFVKVPATLLLSKTGSPTDIHAADLSDLLGRHGISLIAEQIESEAVVVDLLDYDVRFGQGFLFSPPRPVRAEALQGAEAAGAIEHQRAADPISGFATRAAM